MLAVSLAVLAAGLAMLAALAAGLAAALTTHHVVTAVGAAAITAAATVGAAAVLAAGAATAALATGHGCIGCSSNVGVSGTVQIVEKTTEHVHVIVAASVAATSVTTAATSVATGVGHLFYILDREINIRVLSLKIESME